MEKPIFVFQKNADKSTNKIIIPKVVVDNWGYKYSMEVYEDRIVLIPLKKEKGN